MASPIYCPSCESGIPAEDVNLDTLLAKCRRCNAVFSIADRVPTMAAKVPRKRRVISKPPQEIEVELSGPDVSFRRRWFHWSLLGLAFFCLIWDGFLVVWYSIAFFGDANGPIWLMALFPILHLAVGVALTYSVVAGFLNSTWVYTTNLELRIVHGPLPWTGNQTVELRQIKQLYVSDGESDAATRTQGGSVGVSQSATEGAFQVNALLVDDAKVPLLTGIWSIETAEYIEQELEKRLGIEDAPVVGEVLT